MKQYLKICKNVLEHGVIKENRTGINTLGSIGAYAEYDLADGFPIVTTKQTYWKQSVAEMLCFLRGEDNDKAFREAGCKVWTANANANTQWLNNPNRKGEDDLGRIYGVQARDWNSQIDQLGEIYDRLLFGIDDRRLIVSHWNPSDLDKMALPPCHLLYQFGLQGNKLHLSMYQRSCDLPLGVPFNVVGYAWLLMVMAQITEYEVGSLHHFMHDVHIYENQVELMKEQVKHVPHKLPTMKINPKITTLEDLEEWASIDDFELVNYEHDSAIKYPFSV